MRRFVFPVAMAFAMIMPVAQSAARDDITTDDVNCYVVYMTTAASKTGAEQSAAYIGLMYWLGRLDGRTPKLNFKNRVLSALPKLTKEKYESEARRCGSELMRRGNAITQMGKDVSQKGSRNLSQGSAR
jgi:hypothetical protein